MNKLVVEKKQDGSFQISGYVLRNFDITKSGYTPIGIVGFETGKVEVFFQAAHIVDNTNTIHYGMGTRDANNTFPVTPIFYVLYKTN